MDHIRGVWEQTLRDREKRAADIRAEKEKMENPEYLRRDYEKWSAEVEAAMEKMKVRPDERRTIRTAAHHDEIDVRLSFLSLTTMRTDHPIVQLERCQLYQSNTLRYR